MTFYKLLHTLLCAAGIFALAAIGIAALSVQKTSRDVDRLVTADNGLKGTIQDLNSDLVPLGIALDAVARASASQEQYWDVNTKKIGAVLDQANTDLVKFGYATDQLDGLLAWTNRQVNGDLLPALTEQIKSIATLSSALEQDAKQLQVAISDADRAVNNPDISATLGQIKGTTENLNKTASDIYAMVDAYKRNLEKPKNLAWKIFSALTGLGSKAGNIATLAQ